MTFVHASIVGHFDPSDLESVHARRGPVPVGRSTGQGQVISSLHSA